VFPHLENDKVAFIGWKWGGTLNFR